jgi:hypothetical protein
MKFGAIKPGQDLLSLCELPGSLANKNAGDFDHFSLFTPNFIITSIQQHRIKNLKQQTNFKETKDRNRQIARTNTKNHKYPQNGPHRKGSR